MKKGKLVVQGFFFSVMSCSDVGQMVTFHIESGFLYWLLTAFTLSCLSDVMIGS